jgi:outer membrane protein insertion porin family
VKVSGAARLRPRRSALPMLAAVLLVAGSGSAVRAQAIAGDREVVSLQFLGNHAFSDGELASAISTRATHCRSVIFQVIPLCPLTDWGLVKDRAYLDPSTLPADLLRLRLFYRARGFREVQVDTVVHRTESTVRIEFDIQEGEPTRLRALDIRGLPSIFDSAEVRKQFPLKTGDPFDLVRIDQGKQAIANRLRNQGYIDAAVLDEYFLPAASHVAELTLRIQPGPRKRIGGVRIEGAGTIGDEVVGRFLNFGRGGYFSEQRILESQRDLYDLPAIRFANIRAVPRTDSDTLVDVVVEVTPAKPRSVRTGVGVTTLDCFQTQASFTHRDFLGGARQLTLEGRLSNLLARQVGGSFPCSAVDSVPVFQKLNYRLEARLDQPYFFSGHNSLSTSLFLERETVPGIFVRTSEGGELTLTKRLRRRMPLALTFRPELTSFAARSADVYFCINFGFCQPRDIDVLAESRWLSPVGLSWSYDRRNNPFSPTAGYYVTLDLEAAGKLTASDYHYVRFNVNGADFERMGDALVLAARIRTGFVEPTGGRVFTGGIGQEPVVHPRKRFFAGGAQSVRGFGQNLLGPTVLVVDSSASCAGSPLDACVQGLRSSAFDQRPIGGDAAFEVSLELRARVGPRWEAVAFLDAGQVWKDITRPVAPVATPGLGMRYTSPVGPLRLDVAYDPVGAQSLPVVAEVGPQGSALRELDQRVLYNPFTEGNPSGFKEFIRRLQLHVAIGQAF